jgi:hypothetical protein
MKSGVLRVTAFIQKRLVCLLAGQNRHQRSGLVMLSKMTARTTLSVMNRLHGKTSYLSIGLLRVTTSCPPPVLIHETMVCIDP